LNGYGPEQAVYEFLEEYGGEDPFLLSLQSWVDNGRRLTQKQIDAAIKSMARLTGERALAQDLYRNVVKAAHPDLGTDEGDRRWRTRFTVIANRAYEDLDIPALVWLQALLVEPVS
jgi:hypothetical protein